MSWGALVPFAQEEGRIWATDPAAASYWRARAGATEPGRLVHRSKHAATYRLDDPMGVVFVKHYHRYRRRDLWTARWRGSKAARTVTMCAALHEAGFGVPTLVAAGETVGSAGLQTWVVTRAVTGRPLADWLAAAESWSKWPLLRTLGGEVGRLHAQGFVAGDLVPANVWVVGDADVCLLDHDRTCRYPVAAPWWRARRNLVQLGRVPLRGITVADRWRTYRAYAVARGWSARLARRRVAWIVAKTVERRRRFDHMTITRPVRFREVMRADEEQP